MNKRSLRALEILRAGGYFRKALEKNYHGGETFVTRLYNDEGMKVRGIGVSTRLDLEDANMLKKVPVPSSSVWPEKWIIREGV